MSLKNSIQSIPAGTFNSAAQMALVFQPINVGGLPQACFELIISNLSTTQIIYSFDGTTDDGYMAPGQILILRGGSSASQPGTMAALFSKGTVLYVRGTAGAGLIVLAGLYQHPGA